MPVPTIAGIALAAGAGTRLRPLTGLRPKALCPVGGRPLVDLALDRLAPVAGEGPERLAVNAHHFADLLRRHCEGRATVSVEQPEALGTAGGVAALRDWLDGRDALVTNADAYLPGRLELAEGWDGERMRLLCVPLPATAARPDFTTPDGRGVRYVGACLLPWAAVRTLRAEPTGLYELLWRDADARGELDLVVADPPRTGSPETGTVAIDCGTPADYLAANLHASGGASVVGEGAVVLGRLERCVVWDGAHVGPDEDLRDAVRAGTREQPLTVLAAQSG